MSDLHAVVLLNGAPYRVPGLSHDAEGSRIRYPTVDDLEKAVRAKLDKCERAQRNEGVQAAWVGTRDEDHYRVEAHSVKKH